MNGGQGGMRMPHSSLPQDVEVLSEADLAAEGLLTFAALANMTASELMAAAKKFNITATQQEDLPKVIQKILTAQAEEQGQVWAEGILEIVDDGYGFVRRNGLLPSADDVYVPSPMLRRISGPICTRATSPSRTDTPASVVFSGSARKSSRVFR